MRAPLARTERAAIRRDAELGERRVPEGSSGALRAATSAVEVPGTERMLVVDRARARVVDARVSDLSNWLRAGDLLVVNDAATLPASLAARFRARAIELRLVGLAGEPGDGGARFRAVLFGEGDHRIDTDVRPAPPIVRVGDALELDGGLVATVARVDALSPRLVDIDFDRAGAALFDAIYRNGRPVQYAYLPELLPLRAVQTAYAGVPWAVEMPSAGHPLTWRLLLALRRAGVELASVTHAAGLSATGDPAIDRALPLPERYRISARTVALVARAKARGGRVVAVGTTVVRALEGDAAKHGHIVAGERTTDLRIVPGYEPRIVDALLTNVHAPGESHRDLMDAFADPELLDRAHAHALTAGYLAHELGDATLII